MAGSRVRSCSAPTWARSRSGLSRTNCFPNSGSTSVATRTARTSSNAKGFVPPKTANRGARAADHPTGALFRVISPSSMLLATDPTRESESISEPTRPCHDVSSSMKLPSKRVASARADHDRVPSGSVGRIESGGRIGESKFLLHDGGTGVEGSARIYLLDGVAQLLGVPTLHWNLVPLGLVILFATFILPSIWTNSRSRIAAQYTICVVPAYTSIVAGRCLGETPAP